MALSEDVRKALEGTLYGQLLAEVEAHADDYLKAKSGVKTAATRTRNGMQPVRELGFKIREELRPSKKAKDAPAE